MFKKARTIEKCPPRFRYTTACDFKPTVMSKIYLLLRSNRQLGPFTVEELLQHDLKPIDLIWVEGRSAGWSYPQEIEALKPFVKFNHPSTPSFNPASQHQTVQPTHKTPSKNVFVSLPENNKKATASEPASFNENDLEKKAEALRQRAQAYQTQPASNTVQTNYSKDINDLEDNYTGWFYEQSQRKKKQAKQKQRTLVVASLLALVCGYAAIQYFTTTEIKDNKQVAAVTTTQNISSNDAQPQPLANVEQEVTNYEEPKPKQDLQTAPKSTKQNPVPAPSLPSIKTEPATPKETTEEVVLEPKAVYTKPQEEEVKKGETVQKPQEEKKKGLGRFFDKLKGKKKEDAIVEDETTQRTTTNERGERTAQRRGTSNTQQPTGEAAEISLHQIELKATEKSNDWMIGVVGQKITMTNKSAYVVQLAVVEVVYYNEENAVLEKRKVSFNNIAPKRSATLPVPDHRMAAKFDYRLISVTPKQDAIVKN